MTETKRKRLTQAQVNRLTAKWEARGRKDAKLFAASRPETLHLHDDDEGIGLYDDRAQTELLKLSDAGEIDDAAYEGETHFGTFHQAWEDGFIDALDTIRQERIAQRRAPAYREKQLRTYYARKGPRPRWLDEALAGEYDSDEIA